MGFDGNLGTITLDMAAGTAQATDGHKVLSDKDGTVELESTRYPFCFPADQKSADGLRNILAHVSFNQDLNRLMLVVKNLQAEKAKVTWGKQTRSYSKNELSQGINLAAEFLDSPFAEAWTAVDAAVAAKQNYETGLIKGHNRSLAGVAALFPTDAEAVAAVKVLQGKLMGRHQALCEAVRKAQVAVKHTLVVVAGE